VLDWLSGSEIDHAISLVKPFSADLLDGYDVAKLVNSPLTLCPTALRHPDADAKIAT
jgi:hypothetical protein